MDAQSALGKIIGWMNWNSLIIAASLKKIRLDFLLIVALDLLFYGLSSVFIAFSITRLQARQNGIALPTDIASLSMEATEGLLGDVRGFYYLLIFSIILCMMVVIFLAGTLKPIIWARTTGTRITFRLISKFFVLNLIWMGLWFIFLITALNIFKQALIAPIFITTLMSWIYFTNILYALFMKEQKYRSILKAIKLGITKAHVFLPLYFLIILLFFIALRMGSFAASKVRMSLSVYGIGMGSVFFALILISLAAFTRYYISTLVAEMDKRSGR